MFIFYPDLFFFSKIPLYSKGLCLFWLYSFLILPLRNVCDQPNEYGRDLHRRSFSSLRTSEVFLIVDDLLSPIFYEQQRPLFVRLCDLFYNQIDRLHIYCNRMGAMSLVSLCNIFQGLKLLLSFLLAPVFLKHTRVERKISCWIDEQSFAFSSVGCILYRISHVELFDKWSTLDALNSLNMEACQQ